MLEPANIIFDLNQVIFGYDEIKIKQIISEPKVNPFYTLQPGLDILKECYKQVDSNGNRLHRLYILSNWETTGFESLKYHFPQILEMFDGDLISGEAGTRKPHPEIYKMLIKKYNLDNQRCIFIDDTKENVTTADQQGMIGIWYNNPNTTKHQLKALKAL